MSDGNNIYDGPSFAESPDYDPDFYEAPDEQRWCSKCEHWEEDCRCPSTDDPMPLDRTEATSDWIDHVQIPSQEAQMDYWLSDAFNIGHAGRNPVPDSYEDWINQS